MTAEWPVGLLGPSGPSALPPQKPRVGPSASALPIPAATACSVPYYSARMSRRRTFDQGLTIIQREMSQAAC